MLVLSRQKGEVINIGDEIEIVVVDIRGDKVRLGVQAPQEVQVHRNEIYKKIQEEGAINRGTTKPGPSREEIQKHVDAQKLKEKTI